LAFSVAAHLEPEVLIVDEVLSVGDAAFQRKSLGKMGDVARDGRTILFVSHNLDAVDSLCSQCVFLDKGSIVVEGRPRETIKKYLDGSRPGTGTRYIRNGATNDSGPVSLIE